jgi:flagellar biosynthesis/type III secretory pathway protein FliH
MPSVSEPKKATESQNNNQPETRNGGGSLPNPGQSAKDVPNIGERSAEAATRAAGAAAGIVRNLTQRVAEQAQAGLQVGLHAVAEMQAPLAAVSTNQSRQLMEITTSVTDICHEAAQRSGDDVRAVTESFHNLARGLQTYQRAYLDLLSRSIEGVSRKQHDVLHVNSPVKLAEIQRDIYIDVVNNLFAGTTTLLQIAGQIAQDAVRPLQERAQAHGKG